MDGHDVPIGGDCHSSPTAQQARKAGKAGGKDCAGIPNAGRAAPHHEYDEGECQALAQNREQEDKKRKRTEEPTPNHKPRGATFNAAKKMSGAYSLISFVLLLWFSLVQ